MTKIQIFEKVITHLIAQKHRSMVFAEAFGGSSGCAYRGADGRKCAVGCLIPDEHYDPKIENLNVGNAEVTNTLKRAGVLSISFEHVANGGVLTDPDDRDKLYLLGDLQQYHDHLGDPAGFNMYYDSYGNPNGALSEVLMLMERHNIDHKDLSPELREALLTH